MRFISILTILLMAMAPIANAGPPSPPGQPAGTTLQTNSGTTLPATCTTGQMFLDTDADTNGSLYICVATDTWKLDDDDGGAGGGTMTTFEEGDVQVGGADIVTIDCGAGLDCTESPDTEINIVVDLSETGLGSTHDTSGELDALYESATSNDFDPDRIAGDTSDDNLIDEGVIDADITRDSEAAAAYQPLEATLTDIADGTIAENLVNTANPWAENEIASTVVVESDVDDTPANGATTDPVSSNWAYDHANAADPHAGYMLESNIGTGANNYLQLSGSPGTPDTTKFLRDDMTWVTPSGSGDVSKVGTPAQYEWGEWTGDGTIKGTAVSGSSVVCTDSNGSPTACSNLADLAYTNLGQTIGASEVDADMATQAELDAVAALVDTDDEIIAIINASPSTQIVHEAGGLEADVSAYTGLVAINGGSTSNITDAAGLETILSLGAYASDILGAADSDALVTLLELVAGDIPDLSATYEVQLNNEAGLYSVLSDVSDFVQPSEAPLDSDFSNNGFLRRTGSGTYESCLDTFNGSTAPTANEDSGDGYCTGSIFVDTTNDKAYVCLDATSTAAVWTEITQTAAGLTENEVEAYIFDADAESISGVWEVQDDILFSFGNDADFGIRYDETTDDQLEIVSNSATDMEIDINNAGAGGTNLTIDGNVTAEGIILGSSDNPTDYYNETDGTDWWVGTDDTGNSREWRTNATVGSSVQMELDEDGDIHHTGDVYITGDDLFMNTNTDGMMLIADGTNFNPVQVSGDVEITNAGVTSIEAGVIVNADINGSAAIDISKTALVAGTNITLSTNTLNVDDAFLANDGDVGTGVYDFGGATSFEIPNADSSPAATGQLILDTSVTNYTNGALRFYDGTNIRHVLSMVAATAEGCTDDQVASYDADNNLWYCKDDATGSGSLGSNLSSTTNDITTDNDVIQLIGTAEDLDIEFGSNAIDLTSDTGVAAVDFVGMSVDADSLTEGGNAVYNSSETPGGELGGTWASPTIDDTGITLTSITIGALLGVDSIDATGAVDMDYGSVDVTDHTFVSDGGTVVIDGDITTSGVIKGRASYGADITGAVAHDTTATHGVFYHFTAAATVTLDAAADAGYGTQVCYRVRDASEAAVIDLDASEKINLDGTAQAAGVAITSSTQGATVCLVATTDTDGSGTDGWESWGNNGFASE